MQVFTTDLISTTSNLLNGIAHYRLYRKTTEHFFSNIEQTKILMRVKDRLSHSPALV